MKCLICMQAETREGVTDIPLQRGEFRVTLRRIPAQICPCCGEAYLREAEAASLLKLAEEMLRAEGKV